MPTPQTLDAVTFTPAALWVIGALLTALTGAIGVLFKQLQASHTSEMKVVRDSNALLQASLQGAMDYERSQRTAERSETSKLLQSVESAMEIMTSTLRELVDGVRQNREQSGQEHGLMMVLLRDLNGERKDRRAGVKEAA